MAIGWLTVLQSVPWTDVVRNAPKVAAGAKKLWNAVGKTPLASARPTPEAQTVLSPDPQAISALALRIQQLETSSADLQAQMIASSGLIKALAEQNTQLILRIETLRIRMGWMAAALATASLVAAASMVLILLR